jgi:tRNA-2-methylthio-N6-dimethylallyladenosine synthase
MHRPYTAQKYEALVARIRQAQPEVAITTDVIVGFPGEDDVDYAQTRELVERVLFDNAFIFRYSTRADTPAANSLDQTPERVKEERNRDLLAVVDASAHRANDRLVGRTVEILCEGPSRNNPARLMGRTRTNKIVVFEGNPEHTGELLQISVQQANGFSLYGTPLV